MESKPRIKFSLQEKMEFYDDREIKLFNKTFPKITTDDIHKYVRVIIKEMRRTGNENDESYTYFTKEALAIRKLLEVLHRESLHCDRDEITEYLASLSIQAPVCKELVDTVMSPNTFVQIPKSLRLRPTISSLHWLLDISYHQRLCADPSNLENQRKLASTLRIILFITLSNGQKHTMYLKYGRESWLKYLARMAGSALSRVDSCSLQTLERDAEGNESK